MPEDQKKFARQAALTSEAREGYVTVKVNRQARVDGLRPERIRRQGLTVSP